MTRQEYLNRPLIKDVITMDKLIENICSACHCGKCKAQRYLDTSIRKYRTSGNYVTRANCAMTILKLPAQT